MSPSTWSEGSIVLVRVGQVSPSREDSLEVLVSDQRQRDLRVPRRPLLDAAKVDLLPRRQHHGEVHQAALVLDAVHRGHEGEGEVLGPGAGLRSPGAVEPQPVLRQDAALRLPELQETTAALLQDPRPHHPGGGGHGDAGRKQTQLWGGLVFGGVSGRVQRHQPCGPPRGEGSGGPPRWTMTRHKQQRAHGPRRGSQKPVSPIQSHWLWKSGPSGCVGTCPAPL